MNTYTVPSLEYVFQKQMLELKQQIAARMELRDNVNRSLQELEVKLDNLLLRIDMISRPHSEQLLARRTSLEKDAISMQRERVFQDLACWRDVTQLETQLRQVQRDLALLGRKGGGHA